MTGATPKTPLPRAVYYFGATSLANDFASEMISPLLPAFVTGALGGGALALGVLDGAADAVDAGFTPFICSNVPGIVRKDDSPRIISAVYLEQSNGLIYLKGFCQP